MVCFHLWSSADGYFSKQSVYRWVQTVHRYLPTCFYTRMRLSLNKVSFQAGKKHLAQQFNFTYRYIDDVLSLKNTKFAEYFEFIYPRELEIKETTMTAAFSSYLDCYFYIDNGMLATRLYDKQDDFNFPIVNFPFLNSNIPSAPAHGVYVSQLIRHARACSNYQDFMERGKVFTTKSLSQGYQKKQTGSNTRSSMGDSMIWSIPTMRQFPELFLMSLPVTRHK